MIIDISLGAERDLEDYWFYERQSTGLGDYFPPASFRISKHLHTLVESTQWFTDSTDLYQNAFRLVSTMNGLTSLYS